MKGQAKINGYDIWETWGAAFAKGTYEKLLAPPPMKDYIVNSSRLVHGKNIMTHNARTDSRDISIQIFIEGKSEEQYLSRYKSFLDEVQKGDVVLSVPRLKTIFHFVYTGCSSYGDYGLKRGKFTVKLTEPSISNREDIE